MALTAFQRHVCRLLAGRRRAGGESYVAGPERPHEKPPTRGEVALLLMPPRHGRRLHRRRQIELHLEQPACRA